MRAISWATCFGLFLLLLGARPPATAPALREALTLDLGGGVTMEFALIRPGTFQMGSEKGEPDEKPVHKVTLTRPFYLGKFEVTQQQWQALMGENPATFKAPKNPVEGVSWEDCQIFLQKLAEKMPGHAFRLPTEAQWEYACRAGSRTEYSHGDDPARLGEYAWYLANSANTSHPVGQKKPNAWGLYDMHGNVAELCADWYSTSSYAAADATDPTGATSGDSIVLRGESWVSTPDLVRASYRVGTPVTYRNSHVGLRIVHLPPGLAD